MKKILLASASAIFSVLGLSAFKSAKPTTTYYWFSSSQLATNPTFGTPVVTADFKTGTFPSSLLTTKPTIFCNDFPTIYCVFGFTANQVNFTALGNHISSIKVNEVPETRYGKSS